MSNFSSHTHTKCQVPSAATRPEPLSPPEWFSASPPCCSFSPTPSTSVRCFRALPLFPCGQGLSQGRVTAGGEMSGWVAETGEGSGDERLYLQLHAVRKTHQLFLLSLHAKRRARKRRAKSHHRDFGKTQTMVSWVSICQQSSFALCLTCWR